MGDPVIGRKIREAREEKGLKQRQLAERIGVSNAQSISNYERGITDVPRERLQKIAEITGKPISFFVDVPTAPPTLEERLTRLEERQDETVALMTEALLLLRARPRRRASGE